MPELTANSAAELKLPKGMLRYAWPGFGVAGLASGIFALLSKDTHGFLQLLGQIGAKYLLWMCCVSAVYSLARLIIKAITKLGQQIVDHFGRLVENTGNGAQALKEGATALQAVSQRSEAVTQEMQLQIGYVAQQGRNTSDTMQGMVRALMRIEDKLGITPETGKV